MKKFILGLSVAGTLLFGALSDNSVVATIDGKPVRVKDINYFLQGISGDDNVKLQNLPKAYVPELIKQYIDTQIFYKKAKVVEQDPRFKELEKKIAVTYWLAEKLKSIKVSQQEAKEFYNTYKDMYFKQPPQFKARHILVKDKATAEKIINELKGLKGKALEEKFAELAKKYSIGPTGANGGELGWFSAKQMVAPFVKACEKLKPGEITLKPVKTQYGWHVILLEDKKEAGYVPFKDVAQKIVAEIKRKKLEQYLQELRRKANVKLNLDLK